MKLAIDIREACRTHLAGKGRWTRGFLLELLQRDCKLVLYTDAPLPPEIANAASHAEVRHITQRGIWWHIAVARNAYKDSSIDAYISTVSYIVPCLLRAKVPVITVVHDLIAFRPEPHDWKSKWVERLTFKTALDYSSRICTVSQTTADDLLKRFPSIDASKVIPIFAGSDIAVQKTISKANGCVLCIGTLCPRKNQLRLIKAHALLPERLRRDHPLVLIGARGWSDKEIVEAAKETPHVRWVGSCSDAERNSLLSQAAVCAFPSLYEGFGLPVLEAFASGTPVLASRNGSLGEISGDAAFMVDPLSVDSIAEGLRAMLENAGIRHAYAEKGLLQANSYTWEKTGNLFMKALDGIDRRG